jgi:hypothetical protein
MQFRIRLLATRDPDQERPIYCESGSRTLLARMLVATELFLKTIRLKKKIRINEKEWIGS